MQLVQLVVVVEDNVTVVVPLFVLSVAVHLVGIVVDVDVVTGCCIVR